MAELEKYWTALEDRTMRAFEVLRDAVGNAPLILL
jgi:hypothetical protein